MITITNVERFPTTERVGIEPTQGCILLREALAAVLKTAALPLCHLSDNGKVLPASGAAGGW